MVIRPPIETWSRPELEDQYHSVVQQFKEAQKKSSDMEKKVTQMNSRFRRSLVDRKTKEDAVVDREKYDEVVKDNQLLLMKLKTAKHQLLTYTTPSARQNTTSAMTGRSTYRQLSTVRRPVTAAASVGGRSTGQDTDREYQRPVVRINESNLAEKANVIKLNRLVRERNAQIAELQYQIERMSAQVHDLRNQLEQRAVEMAVVDSTREDMQETDRRDELLRRELELARTEMEVLKDANERLVRQSLSHDFNSGATERVELKKEIAVLEERVREAERREKEVERRRRHDKQSFEEWRQREKKRHIANPTAPVMMKPLSPQSDRSSELSASPAKKSKKKDKSDDILMRLYRDVAGILDSHGDRNADDILDVDMAYPQKVARWQKMYSELYDEMEKVRNMLLLQHNINQKQSSEIAILQEELDRVKTTAELRIDEMRQKVEAKQKRIIVLEEQIRSIAYSGQKPVASIGQSQETPSGLSTELSIRLSSVEVSPEMAQMSSSFFLSLEFFDFELQTTPLMPTTSQKMDYTTVYNIVVSSLFVHYLQANGITVEMYRPKGASYELIGAAMVTLGKMTEKASKSHFGGMLNISSVSNGKTLATIEYEIVTTNELSKALTSYQRVEAAQNLLPLEIVTAENSFEQLTVSVQRCSRLDTLTNDSSEVCVVYEFLSFSPFFTDTVSARATAEFASSREWSIPAENTHRYLADTDITFFLVDPSQSGGDGVLAMVSLPLAPLAAGQAIRGSFPMIKADGSDSGAFLDVSISWKNGLIIRDRRIPEVEAPRQPMIERTTSVQSLTNDGLVPPAAEADVSDYVPSLSSTPTVSDIPADEEQYEILNERHETDSLSSRGSNDTIILESGTFREPLEEVPPSPKAPSPSAPMESPSSPKSTESAPKGQIDGRTVEDQLNILSSLADLADTREKLREKERDEIRSLLGELPPIAKPRLTRPPSSFVSPLDIIQAPVSPDSSLSSDRESEPKDGRQRRIEFSSPLHNSIPPSEASSISSPPARRERRPVALPVEGGRSVIKPTQRTEYRSDNDDGSVVLFHIDRLYNLEKSPLLQRRFEGVRFYIDWTFLDFPEAECRVPVSQTLNQRAANPSIAFNYKKEYRLSQRRVALLEQYVETQNHLEFALVTEAGQDSEELAVGLLELARTPTDERVTLKLTDVHGQPFADLDIVLFYSPTIFDSVTSSHI